MVPLMLWLAGAMISPIAAQEIAPGDRSDIAARIDAFDAAIRAGRMGDTLDFLPPRVLQSMIEQSGVSEKDFRATTVADAAEALKVVKLVSTTMDMNVARVGLTSQPRRPYMLIPTNILMEIPNGRRMRIQTTTLAMKESERWYLISIDSKPKLDRFTALYPEFASVEIPPATKSFVN